MNMVLRKGSKGQLVKLLQELLQRMLGLDSKIDGDFGPKTKANVVQFQRKNGLVPDGIVGPVTWQQLDYNPSEFFADTDTTTSATWVSQHLLPDGEYVDQVTSKKYVFLHHTAGRHNPYQTIDNWAKDQRGRIGTHYVIGGLSGSLDATQPLSKEQTEYNGKIVQAIDDSNWGFHLGRVESSYMHRHSLSIELCSAGFLELRGGKYYTWYGAQVHPSQVVSLDHPFKGKLYHHRYSDDQIKSLKALLLKIRDKHGISYETGLKEWIKEDVKTAFDYKKDADLGKVTGLLSHSNVRTDKFDVFPQPELIKMISEL